MGQLLKINPKSHQITKAEWRDCVKLALQVEEAEAILKAMKADLAMKRRSILAKLEGGGSIEDGGYLY